MYRIKNIKFSSFVFLTFAPDCAWLFKYNFFDIKTFAFVIEESMRVFMPCDCFNLQTR